MTLERLNLMNMAKLSIKSLIEAALALGRSLDSDYAPLQQFFVILEHCLKHGLKVKKSFLGQSKSFWGPLELVERLCPEAAEIAVSVRDLPGLKTPVGRGRAWLRLALMQKTLSDYMKALVARKDLLSEFYEPGSLMLEEEGAVISGMMVGLNVLDANLCMKGEDLDTQVGVIDFTMYLKDGSSSDDNGNANMTAVLDQKNYLEELNRGLNVSLGNLQLKVEILEKVNKTMVEELAVVKRNELELRTEAEKLRSENATLVESTHRKMEAVRVDMDTELQTYRHSRQGLDELYSEARKQLREESQLRLEVENELELQISMKQEMEMAMRLLEKDVHEKQDALVSLREQLQEVKDINMDISHKAQSAEALLKQKMEGVRGLEERNGQMTATVKQLEQKLRQSERERQTAEEDGRRFRQDFGEKIGGLQRQLDERDKQRAQLEADLKIEREWRQALQKELQREKEAAGTLQTELRTLQGVKQELQRSQEENRRLKGALDEQEQTLQELGGKLSEYDGSKLKMEDIKEVNKALQGQVWLKDQDATNCKLCEKEFSISRRKHHCRNCGEIFCNSCSDNELPLPSSPKPVRVCDLCHALLLQRYSSGAV